MLICAKVIDVLKETGIIQDNDLGHLVVDEINRIPTAYDVDAVVEKMGNISEPIRPVGWSRKIEAVETKAVLDIVRSGGKE